MSDLSLHAGSEVQHSLFNFDSASSLLTSSVLFTACDLISNRKVQGAERNIMEATRQQEAFRDMGRRPIKGMEEPTSEEVE